MLNVEEKDITEVSDGFIVHQVNCMGKMGSGVAGQLRKKYPIIFNYYTKVVNEYIKNAEANPILGTANIVPINDKLFVVNAFTQYNYGYDGKLYTNYESISRVFNKLNMINYKHRNIYIPYKYGCGLGGGNWTVVQALIEKEIPSVIVCKRKEDD